MKRLFYLFTALGTIVSAAHAQIAASTVRSKIPGIDVIAYKSGVKDVVYLRGTLPAGDSKDPADNPMIASLVSDMLDRGTTKHTKDQITEMLESVGASISFSAGDNAAEFNARCLSKDVPLVVSLLAEQLREPAFSAEEFDRLKKQLVGRLKRAQESTDFRATDAFTRAVYSSGHPNRQATPDEKIAAVQAATLDQVKAFHAKHYGPAYFTLVAAGDLDLPALQAELGKSFAGWTGGTAPLTTPKSAPVDSPKEQTVFMADKTSVSVTFGQATGLHYGDPDYFALRTATAVLGSGFTGRLMGNVRDKEGLTYGIGSRISNDTFNDGDWRISATFAPALLDKGIASAKRQLDLWRSQGVTDAELEKRKGDLIGTFKVSLATTDGMAGALLAAVNRGLDVNWLDEYPKKIASLTTAEVNGAIKKYVKPESMFLIKAGTIPGATPAAAPAKN